MMLLVSPIRREEMSAPRWVRAFIRVVLLKRRKRGRRGRRLICMLLMSESPLSLDEDILNPYLMLAGKEEYRID